MKGKFIKFMVLNLFMLGILTIFIFPFQTQDEYRSRREAVREKMLPNSVMILRSKGSLGVFHTEAQDGNFYYLTGINEPQAFLVLVSPPAPGTSRTLGPGAFRTAREMLFLMPRDSRRPEWDAQPIGLKFANEKMGFKNVRPSSEFKEYFERILLGTYEHIYLDYERSRGLMEPLTADEQVLKKAREKGAAFKLLPPGDILSAVGQTRSPSEIALITKAVDITAEAQIAAMQSIKPGMYEYQLQAIIEYVYSLNAAQRSAFASIIGSGINSCILHWMKNDRKMQSGDLVVVDIGAEYNFYGADITRTIPVSGKYSKRQKEVYEIVLAANTAAIDMVAPGVQFRTISNRAAEIVGEGLVRLGLIKDKKEYRKYYYHGLGHFIGLRVGGRARMGKLEPGMVITIEPGIYIREEELGVRIEDDVLVTETGHEVLSRRVPKTIPEIEQLMKKKGMDYTQYLIKK